MAGGDSSEDTRRLRKQFGAFAHGLRRLGERGLLGGWRADVDHLPWLWLANADESPLLLLTQAAVRGSGGMEGFVRCHEVAGNADSPWDAFEQRRLMAVWRFDTCGRARPHPEGDTLAAPIGHICDDVTAHAIFTALMRKRVDQPRHTMADAPTGTPFVQSLLRNASWR